MNLSEIVDRGATHASFLVKIPVEGMTTDRSDVRSATITTAQLAQGLGVKTAGQFNVKSIKIGHPTVIGDDGAQFAFTFGHPDGTSLNTPGRHALVSDGTADAYHYIHTHNSSFGGTTLEVQPTAAAFDAQRTDALLDYKRLLRWRASPQNTSAPFYNLLTPDSVNAGVTRSVMGEDRRMVVLPTDSTGKLNAVHQLVMRNKVNTDFMDGKFADGVRTDVNFNGRDGFVMTESDFNAIAEPLKASLDTAAAHPLAGGLVVRAHKLDDSFNPTHIYLPLTFNREVPRLSETFDRPNISLNNVAEAIEGVVQGGKGNALLPSLAAAIHGAKSVVGKEASFEALQSIPE